MESATYLTIREACVLSGYSRSTIGLALRGGDLRHYRIGRGRGRVRIDPADLEAWAAPRPATRRSDRGFTLIELLVVVLIIGILAGIAIPVFMHQKGKAADASVKAQANTVAKAIETAFVDGAGVISGDSATGAVAVAGGGTQTVKTTSGVRWAVSGNESAYCVAATADRSGTKYTDAAPLIYDSTKGGLLPAGSSCSVAAPTIPNGSGTPLPAPPVCTVYGAGGVVDATRSCVVTVGTWVTWGTSASGGATVGAAVTITPSPVVASYAAIRWDLSAGPGKVLPVGWDWSQQVPISKNLVTTCAFDGAGALITATTAPGFTAPTTYPQWSFAHTGTSAC